jgi:hypothetical protein
VESSCEFGNEPSTFGFHKMLGSYQKATQLVASQVVLSSIELVGLFLEREQADKSLASSR